MLSWNYIVEPKGFLFIGDPHASSVRPGKRNDDFEKSVLNKLIESAKIATHFNLIPVILGDLIHREGENSIGFISRLTKVLKTFPCTPLEIDGNHGKHESTSVEEDVEYLLKTSGTIKLLEDPAEKLMFSFGEQKVSLFVAPYGTQMPYSLKREIGHINILVSHHDLGFESAYPGAMPLREIKDCDIVVNGHMHKTAPSVLKGKTTWHCPGNIEPLSLDCRDHNPAVWEWRPDMGCTLEPHYLSHNRDCFNLTGTHVNSSSAIDGVEALAPHHMLKNSRFAQMLASSEPNDSKKTDEAAFLSEDLDDVIETIEVSSATATLLRLLASQVISEASNLATPK